MPQIQLYLDDVENGIITQLGNKWSMSKVDVIKTLIRQEDVNSDRV